MIVHPALRQLVIRGRALPDQSPPAAAYSRYAARNALDFYSLEVGDYTAPYSQLCNAVAHFIGG